VLVVAKCFADGLYINAFPRQFDSPNGTALIKERPALSAALLQASKLRKQFLRYFVEGTFIGDSVLNAPANAFVRAYQLDGKLLVIALNDRTRPQAASISSDLGLWLPSSKSYEVRSYEGLGQERGSARIEGARWFGSTGLLQPGEMAFFEVTTK
jgi:hypothetical protein